MLSLEETDKTSEYGSPNTSPIVDRSIRDSKIKKARTSMKLTLFGTPKSSVHQESFTSSHITGKKVCGSWTTPNQFMKEQATWEKDDIHYKLGKTSDRKATEEGWSPNMDDDHKGISVGLYNDKPNEAYYGNLVSLDSIGGSDGSGSQPDQAGIEDGEDKLSYDEKKRGGKDNGEIIEEAESPSLMESPGLHMPLFSRSIESEGQELKEELQIEEGQDIYLIKNDFGSYYREEDILGEGASGTVKKCIKIGTEQSFAVKTVRYRGDTELLHLIVKEFKNHKNLNHKNIIKVYELYIDYVMKRIHTVMELAECKEMFETIQDLGNYSEAVASEIFKQILSGVNYLHMNGVCHRDIKPNNILVSIDAKIVKITDFNVSKFTEKMKYSGLSTQNYKMWTHTGTIAFTAPEVFTDSEYTESVDMWSAGVVLYTMLCGYQPFQSDNVQELIEMIKEAKYEFHSDPWDNISQEAKDLIKRLLDVNLKTRFSPFQALTHSWVANQGKNPKKCISGVIENLWNYLNKNSNKQEGKLEKNASRPTAGSKGSIQELSTPLLYTGSDNVKSSPPVHYHPHQFLSPAIQRPSNNEKKFDYNQDHGSPNHLGLEKSLSFGLVEGQANFFKLTKMHKEQLSGDDLKMFRELKNSNTIHNLTKVCETLGEEEDQGEAENLNENEQITCVRDSDDEEDL